MKCKECGHPIKRRRPSGQVTVSAVRGGRVTLTKATLLRAGIRPGDRLMVKVLQPGRFTAHAPVIALWCETPATPAPAWHTVDRL